MAVACCILLASTPRSASCDNLPMNLLRWSEVNAVSPGATKTDKRMPAAFGVDELGQRVRTQTHPSNIDAAVEAVTPLRTHASPADHAGAYVLLASRRDGRVMTGSVVQTEAGLGVRGLRRVRGGDDLKSACSAFRHEGSTDGQPGEARSVNRTAIDAERSRRSRLRLRQRR